MGREKRGVTGRGVGVGELPVKGEVEGVVEERTEILAKTS